MKIVITDTNILFDVIKIGALPEFFSLDYEICTTVFVMHEILPSPQKELVETFIRAKKLHVYEFSEEEIEAIQTFNTERDLKRFTDKSIIWKSLQLNCPMLTGDQRMREVAEKMNIEVHGSIWIIDELITKSLISFSISAEMENNQRKIRQFEGIKLAQMKNIYTGRKKGAKTSPSKLIFKYRNVADLLDISELSVRRIAGITGHSVNTVRKIKQLKRI